VVFAVERRREREISRWFDGGGGEDIFGMPRRETRLGKEMATGRWCHETVVWRRDVNIKER
jgi:hypothetical protein